MEIKPDNKKIRTVLIEDEPKSMLSLETLLSRYCPEVEVVGRGRNVKEGYQVLHTTNPDLALLDISMPDGDAFQLLNQINQINFEIIFITAYNDYALKAFEYSALHYLLKPINYLDLQLAIQRYQKVNPKEDIQAKLNLLQDNLQNNFEKISLPTQEGLTVIEIKRIIRIEASSNYSLVYFDDGESLIVSKTLHQFEDILSGQGFCRIHNTHLINLAYIKKYQKGRGGTVSMTDGTKLSVSAGRKKEFLEKLGRISLHLGDQQYQS